MNFHRKTLRALNRPWAARTGTTLFGNPHCSDVKKLGTPGEESTLFYGLPCNAPYNPPHNKRVLDEEEEERKVRPNPDAAITEVKVTSDHTVGVTATTCPTVPASAP
jgi:hypothetical protein